MLIYKICSDEIWREAQNKGEFTGMPVDVADGFIHFSTKDQLNETFQKYFKGQRSLILLTLQSKDFDEKLMKWEKSRNNDLFPHLYGFFSCESVIKCKTIEDSALSLIL
jgi:uncharacterized protein (DUF952 family)